MIKRCDIFPIFALNLDCSYLLEWHHLGSFNEYSQFMFTSQNEITNVCKPSFPTYIFLWDCFSRVFIMQNCFHMMLFFIERIQLELHELPVHLYFCLHHDFNLSETLPVFFFVNFRTPLVRINKISDETGKYDMVWEILFDVWEIVFDIRLSTVIKAVIMLPSLKNFYYTTSAYSTVHYFLANVFLFLAFAYTW